LTGTTLGDAGRAGRYFQEPDGYRAFHPADLPPSPPVELAPDLILLLSEADRALARLDGVASMLPNPDLFVAMYVKREAVLSSQIEGTQSTLEDVLAYEIEPTDRPSDVEEVVNYVAALNFGLRRLPELPLSLRLIREIHQVLLSGVRGQERSPGEFRRTQNWIGGANLRDAVFVPPPVQVMRGALDNFEKFLHDGSLPILIHCALAHGQFETIHPFLDGNGRVGRLLIALLLCERQVLQLPLLYLSVYLRAHHAQYYDRLMAIRNDGDWEGWIRFFLRGVVEVSASATGTARRILLLREEHRQVVAQRASGRSLGMRLLDELFVHPIIRIRDAERYLGCTYQTAAGLVDLFEELGLLEETTGQQRNRRYRYKPYLAVFEGGLDVPGPAIAGDWSTMAGDVPAR